MVKSQRKRQIDIGQNKPVKAYQAKYYNHTAAIINVVRFQEQWE